MSIDLSVLIIITNDVAIIECLNMLNDLAELIIIPTRRCPFSERKVVNGSEFWFG